MMPLSTKVLLKIRENCTAYLKRTDYDAYKKIADQVAKDLNYERKYIHADEKLDKIIQPTPRVWENTPDYQLYANEIDQKELLESKTRPS